MGVIMQHSWWWKWKLYEQHYTTLLVHGLQALHMEIVPTFM